MKQKASVGYNNEVVKSLTKEQLVKQMPHVAKEDVEAHWDKINDKSKVAKETK